MRVMLMYGGGHFWRGGAPSLAHRSTAGALSPQVHLPRPAVGYASLRQQAAVGVAAALAAALAAAILAAAARAAAALSAASTLLVLCAQRQRK